MTIKELLEKVLKGAELTDKEKEFLAAYNEPEVKDPGADKDRIPKSRLDQELARRKELEKKADELQQQLDELQNKDLSEQEKQAKEADKIKKQLEKLQQERDEAVTAHAELEFRSKVSEIAGKHNFVDSEYLGFLARRQKVDLNDEAATKTLMEGLKKDAPKFFKVETSPGAGTQQNVGAENDRQTNFKTAADKCDIDAMINNAPVVEPVALKK